MTHTIKFGEPFVARYAPLTDQPGGKSVIQPGMKTYLRTEPTEIVTKQALDSLRTRSGVLYVFGEILYDDIFNEHHRTTFCYFMHQSLAGFSACDTYNDAD